jgi:hypothetical protein
LQGWFEVESVDPGGHDVTVVEYSVPDPFQRTWIPVGQLIGPPNPGGAPERPYSNNGLD